MPTMLFATRAKMTCALLLLIVGGISTTQLVRATPPLALDGLGTHTTCTSRGITTNNPLCDAQALTTTRGHDVIVLVGQCGCSGISSIIDTYGLTFIQHLTYHSRVGDTLWEYYARATLPLQSDNITVVFSQNTWRHGIQVIGIHGANTRGIFDPNPSIPATVSCPGPDCGDCTADFNLGTCSASIETSTLDFVIAGTSINDAGPCGVVQGVGGVPGFTTTTTNNGYGGWFEVDYTVTTTSQTKLTFNCNGTDATAIVVDAISFHGAFGIDSS